MKLKTAAQYCDMSEPYFTKLEADGLLPKPLFGTGRAKRYDRNQIDKSLDALALPDNAPAPAMGGRRI